MSRAPIQTALARTGGKPVGIPVDFGEAAGGVVIYEFNPSVGLELVERMSGLSEIDATGPARIAAQFHSMHELLRQAATPETAAMIDAALEEKRLDIGALMALGSAVIEEVTGANPTKPQPSPPAAPLPGASSTGGVQPEARTLPHSPPPEF